MNNYNYCQFLKLVSNLMSITLIAWQSRLCKFELMTNCVKKWEFYSKIRYMFEIIIVNYMECLIKMKKLLQVL